ncbi:hypothetical protein G7046_g892 [Stylonectria norvegica]|nr:hypothetical protein G7046_g892 [Stylonectria norvegica]
MNQNRTLYCVFSLALVLLLFAAMNQWGVKPTEVIHQQIHTHFGVAAVPTETLAPSFEEVALKHGTDKVTTHKYQFMYDKYLRSFHGKPIKLLEIGLGCNMDYGPGASYYTWLEFLPGVELYFIEYDAQCAEKYKHKTTNARVFTGDQADTDFLAQFSMNATEDGLFDVIIDDGGHTMNQQIVSLEHLWKIVKPGGLYVIEDLQTSYWEQYGGDTSAEDAAKYTTMKYLFSLLDDMMAGWERKPSSHDLQSLDCMAEICALKKKE